MASFYSGDRIDAVVVDIGAASTKIGWAGDDYPRSYFRSVRRFNRLSRMQQQALFNGAKDLIDAVFVIRCRSLYALAHQFRMLPSVETLIEE
jgi:actin-related protein